MNGEHKKYIDKKHENILKPESAHWCSTTNSMILGLDHFCPWINNSIGILNFKSFFLFNIYTCIACIIHLLSTVDRGLKCSRFSRQYCFNTSKNYIIYFIMFNIFLAFFGFIFTYVMTMDCITRIKYNLTLIDRLQNKTNKTSFRKTFKNLMGNSIFTVFLPIDFSHAKRTFDTEINKTLTILSRNNIYKYNV